MGFEAKPVPIADSTEFKKFALIGVGIAFALFLIFSPGIPTPGSPATMQKEKYVAPKRNHQSYRSIEERRSVQGNIDQMMKKNEKLFQSFRVH